MDYLSNTLHQTKAFNLNESVTEFINALNYPLQEEITALKKLTLSVNKGMARHIKWNGLNSTFRCEDRIIMRIHPPKQLQLMFRRGAELLDEPEEK